MAFVCWCPKDVSGTATQRIRRIRDELIEVGVDKDKAISLAALSRRESGSIWIQPHELYRETPDSPCACRVVIGNEYLAPEGSAPLWRKDVTNDARVRAFIKSKGGLGPTVSSGHYVQVGAAAGTNNQFHVEVFEHIVKVKSGSALAGYSIGPTQMWMGHAKMCGVAVYRPTWPETWEQLWTFWKSRDLKALADAIRYLDPGETKRPWPAADDSESNLTQWCAFQSGPSGASAYAAIYKSDLAVAKS